MNELTQEHCEAFDGYVRKWQVLLNLNDWRIERGLKRPKKVYAQITRDRDARLATYYIGASFGAEAVTPDSLERTVIHELLHVFLADHANDPSEGNEHKAINVLEKLLIELR